MSLAELPNLGEKSAQMLTAAGIYTREQLEQLGPVRSYLAAKQAGGNVSLNLLWAIAGTLADIKWNELPEETKEQLKEELKELTEG